MYEWIRLWTMNKEFYVKAEEVYRKEKSALLRSRIYDIWMCIMFDTYLSEDDDLVDSGGKWDYIEE